MPVMTTTEVVTPQKADISKNFGFNVKKLTGQLNGHITPPASDLGSKSPPVEDRALASIKAPHGKGMTPFSLKEALIPQSAGLGMVKKYYQQRTLYQYLGLSAFGLYTFAYSHDTQRRAAALGLLFPGAGLIAVATVPALLSFVITIGLMPVVMLVWFGMGGVFFPLALYLGSAALAGLLAEDRLFDFAGFLWATICTSGLLYLWYKSKGANAAAYSKQQTRNKYLVKEIAKNQDTAVPAPPPGSRELDEHSLRFVQHMLERGLSDFDDLSYHDVVDQFQTAAVRYQIYGVIDCLALYQAHYAPGYHGSLLQACKNSIDKSCTNSIMYYWKWEQLFGKFNTSDLDPIKEDNIMLTGHLGVAMGLFESASGDRSYHEKDSLDFVVGEGNHYKKNYQDLADALLDNMERNVYCLYPCEPNWTYSLCNLLGYASLVISDRILGLNYVEKIRPRFEKALEEEFTDRDGTMLPIRSELTGMTIPGLCGSLNDCIVAMLLTACLPHIAHRNWAVVRKETIAYDDKGKLCLQGLKGADKLDPGNYKSGEGAIRAFIAAAAAEFGDEKVRKDALDQLDNEYFPVEATSTGSLRNKGLSATTQVIALMARLLRHEDLANASLHGPDPNALKGPLLNEAPFPEVLVAKAYSADGVSLDCVLYNGKAAGDFSLQFTRLEPGASYVVTDDSSGTFVADANGELVVTCHIDGRTPISIRPE